MKALEKQLLKKWQDAEITTEEFNAQFPIDIKNNSQYVIDAINKAIKSKKADELETVIHLIWLTDNKKPFIDILNTLLINPNHRSHQVITKTIQSLKNPSSIKYIEHVLATKFDYLAYTCSESNVIAKWFSWALYSIGTQEAIDAIKKYAKSDDEGIRSEMLYRLKNIEPI
jgi:hypothetical protein